MPVIAGRFDTARQTSISFRSGNCSLALLRSTDRYFLQPRLLVSNRSLTDVVGPDSARYALYFAPRPASAWWRAGCDWLGRDAATGHACTQPPIPGVTAASQRQLTATAARYGFHATLKAPFRLAAGAAETDLLNLAAGFAAREMPLDLPALAVRPLGNFLALQLPADSSVSEAVAGLAMRCVEHFDALRAPPSSAELARRRASALSVRQNALLTRWGYPYTEEEFRLHFTLTDDMPMLAQEARHAVRQAANALFAAPLGQHPQIDALTIFREPAPGQPFTVWRRFEFNAASTTGV